MARVVVHDQADFGKCLTMFIRKCHQEGIAKEIKRKAAHVPKPEMKRQDARLKRKANEARQERLNRHGR